MGNLEHEAGIDQAVALDEAVLLVPLAGRAVAVVLALGRLTDPARHPQASQPRLYDAAKAGRPVGHLALVAGWVLAHSC